MARRVKRASDVDPGFTTLRMDRKVFSSFPDPLTRGSTMPSQATRNKEGKSGTASVPASNLEASFRTKATSGKGLTYPEMTSQGLMLTSSWGKSSYKQSCTCLWVSLSQAFFGKMMALANDESPN